MANASVGTDSESVLTSVRLLQLSDLPNIMPIEQRCYEFPWTENIFRDCFRSGYYGLALSDSKQELLGYGMLSVAAGEAHVLNIAIDTPWRGRGWGKRLLRRLLDQARWYRAERVFLEVRKSNHGAIALYHQIGFNEIGERIGYYPARKGREDAVIMALDLFPEPPKS
jgi:[ribosomal protein S18]-alanine N-acetyltransferase